MRRLVILFLFFAFLALAILTTSRVALQGSYDIVVYGGGFAGCAAARNAAAAAPDRNVVLIVPEPGEQLGGLGTVGGQNFADIRFWKGQLVTRGSFGRWLNEAGQFYNTRQMAEIIEKDLQQYANLEIIFNNDLRGVKKRGGHLGKIVLSPLFRGSEGRISWGPGKKYITGKVFIDASDDGKLARLAGASLTVGREDWPAEFLPVDEKNVGKSRQQAATLMFQVRGVKLPPEPLSIGDIIFSKDSKGSWGLAGGKETWRENPLVVAFNEKYGPRGFSVKPINAAQDGAGSDLWWVNMLLIYNVDGRANERDEGTALFPEKFNAEQLTTDEGRVKARRVLGTEEFAEVLRQFKVSRGNETYGFGEAELIKNEKGLPEVGQILYLRETVHGQLAKTTRINDSENYNFALATDETQRAGAGPGTGRDRDHYPERIGLAYYTMDINAYMFEDLKRTGRYLWPVTGILRPDWQEKGGEPQNPVYLPYRMLLTGDVDNLLLPGYATGASSLAWAEIRVLPNLTVLGDAAGIAAARAVLEKKEPREFTPEDIIWLQTKLVQFGARLDK